MRDLHLRQLFADDPARGERFTAEAVRAVPGLLQEPRHRRDSEASGSTRRGVGPASADRCHVPRRDDQRHRASRRATRSPARAEGPVDLRSTGRTSCPRCTRCSTRWRLLRAGPRSGEWKGHTGQPDPQCGQHRNRRLGSRSGDGLRGAPALQRQGTDVPLRLQRRRDRFRRGDTRPRSGRDAVHRLLQDVHDARDDDQRPDGPRLVPAVPSRTRRRSPGTSSPSRPTPRK